MNALKFFNTLKLLAQNAKLTRKTGTKQIELISAPGSFELRATCSVVLQFRATFYGDHELGCSVDERWLFDAKPVCAWLSKFKAKELEAQSIELNLIVSCADECGEGLTKLRFMLGNGQALDAWLDMSEIDKADLLEVEKTPELESLSVLSDWQRSGWRKAFNSVIKSMSDDDARVNLYQLASFESDETPKLWATDGHRLISVETPQRWPLAKTHGDLAKALAKLGKCIDGVTVLAESPNVYSKCLRFLELRTLSKAKLCGVLTLVSYHDQKQGFPPVHQIKTSAVATITLKAPKLRALLVQARVIHDVIRFDFLTTEQALRVRCDDIELGVYSGEMDCSYKLGRSQWKRSPIGVQSKYLVQALDSFPSKEELLTIKLSNDPLDPITLEAGGVESVVMPWRI